MGKFKPILRPVLFLIVGAVTGALLGYASQCAGGTCPLMCAWWRGAIVGGILGLVFHLSGTSRPAKPAEPSPEQKRVLEKAESSRRT